ncbi:MAG TPA: heme o synthase [Nocardioidaceae bacterium]|nr:heme o synthase [Nocardioidaceae bacterium]
MTEQARTTTYGVPPAHPLGLDVTMPIGRLPAARQIVADYVRLTKPRIISLLLLTAICGMYAAARGPVPWRVLVALCCAGYLAPGGANAMNCAFDGDIDKIMTRTSGRPVPSGRISRPVAFGYGVLLNVVAAIWLALATNPLAAGLALAGSIWYVGVYTIWLKRRSKENIVIGGAAGCFPVLVGWAAATGSLSLTAFLLAAVVFCWTPPHFWSLATLLRDDYRQAHVPMLPVVAPDSQTSLRMMRYAVATLVVSILPVLWGGLGVAYLVVAVLAGVRLCQLTWACRSRLDARAAGRLFGYSLMYLAIIFLAAALDQVFTAPVFHL